jgi:G6PDH family F420-dependent oxidoreductase
MTNGRMEVGFALSSEEHGPMDLVDQAVAAEQAGFRTIAVSDHFHPWTHRQGHSPMVWPVLGAIAARTSDVRFGTAVTCPILRTHPAVIAHAAGTVAAMAEDRFFLGVGSGENLNEHVLGQPWPTPAARIEMLTEAMELMRMLWTGAKVTVRGKHYQVDRAQLFTLPATPPPIYMSAFGQHALRVAAEHADGYVGTSPDATIVAQLNALADRPLPKIGYDRVCWGASEASARELLHDVWPVSGLPGQLSQELPTVELFEEAAELVDEEKAVGSTPCGPDVEPYLKLLTDYERAGYDCVCLLQVGDDQEGWLRFWRDELQPAWAESLASTTAR